MVRVIRLLVTLALGAALAVSPALAQAIHINPVPPHVKPQWTPVPGVPQVYYAPNLPTDVFRYRGKYYFFWADYFYKGNQPTGPWQSVKEVPAPFHQIAPAYFKTATKAKPPAAPPESTAPPETAPPPESGAPAPPEPAPESAQPEQAAPEATQEPPAPPPAAPPGEPEKPPKVM